MVAQHKCLIAALLSIASFGVQAALPPDVLRDLQKDYAGAADAAPTRYVEGLIDLDGDGKNELLVHVVGPTACGSGGCPTLVYIPSGGGYWRMATIGLTNPPIRASATRTKGWRNLIVAVSGGGAEAGDVELAFDGRGYPRNPTVRSAHVTAAKGGGDVIIAALASIDQATPLPQNAAAAPARSNADSPSFACAKASLPAEKTVCASRELAALDRQLNELYSEAMRAWPADVQTRQRAAQKQWLGQRNACSKRDDAPVCLRDAYKRRQIELQIQSGKLEAPTPKSYLCKGHEGEPFFVTHYATDPAAAVLTWSDRQVVALATPSAGGTRYAATGVEFFENDGEINVTWAKTKLVCTAQ